MLVKKSIVCPKCNNFTDYYTEEHKPIIGEVIKCKCGVKIKCIKETKYITKWREIKNEKY